MRPRGQQTPGGGGRCPHSPHPSSDGNPSPLGLVPALPGHHGPKQKGGSHCKGRMFKDSCPASLLGCGWDGASPSSCSPCPFPLLTQEAEGGLGHPNLSVVALLWEHSREWNSVLGLSAAGS